MGEVVYVLGKTVSDMVCCSHANPLLQVLTGYIARKPAIPCLGGAAHAHISGLTCALVAPRAHERAQARIRGPMCEASGPCARRWRTSSEQFRMQFDWVNVQQCLQTLQFQRCECVVRHRVGGIACDILR